MLLLSSLLGLGTPLLCLILHVLAYRLIPQLKSVPRQKLTALIILTATLINISTVAILACDALESLHVAVVSLLFGYTYFHWFNMSETARRIRILVRYVALGIGPDGGEEYSSEVIFQNRLRRLTETGTIQKVGDRYSVNRGPLLYATRVILFWRALYYPAMKKES
jgi:hypothetical protein